MHRRRCWQGRFSPAPKLADRRGRTTRGGTRDEAAPSRQCRVRCVCRRCHRRAADRGRVAHRCAVLRACSVRSAARVHRRRVGHRRDPRIAHLARPSLSRISRCRCRRRRPRRAQQFEVVCWSREWPVGAAALSEAGVDLEVGRVERVRGRVSVWEGGSKLRFTLTALDVEALLGGIAAARRRLLLALEAEGLLDKNRRLPLPIVPLRIGLVTSPGSEAYRDFVGQLKRSGFGFAVRLRPRWCKAPRRRLSSCAARSPRVVRTRPRRDRPRRWGSR